jgi:hypothetical protein
MIVSLIIESAMVNPKGKAERASVQVGFDMLNDEWVQIRNISRDSIALSGLSLYHWVYQTGTGGKPQQQLVMRLRGQLPPLAAIRIHSGKNQDWWDTQRNIYHSYINPKKKFFLYQISKPDRLILMHGGGQVDYVDYEPPVPVGRRLKRVEPHSKHLLKPKPPKNG